MSNLQNEQCMEDAFEEIVEDNISKRDLVGVLEVTLQRLFIEIKAEESDKDDKARDKAKHFCEKNKDFWIKGD